MLCSCTNRATVGVRGLISVNQLGTPNSMQFWSPCCSVRTGVSSAHGCWLPMSSVSSPILLLVVRRALCVMDWWWMRQDCGGGSVVVVDVRSMSGAVLVLVDVVFLSPSVEVWLAQWTHARRRSVSHAGTDNINGRCRSTYWAVAYLECAKGGAQGVWGTEAPSEVQGQSPDRVEGLGDFGLPEADAFLLMNA